MKKISIDKKNFIWNMIGLTAYSFVSLFSLIIVKYINGVNEAGIFTYAFSITTLFFYISLYYNRTFQIANYNLKNSFNHYITTRFLTAILSLILAIVFSIVSGFSFHKIIIIIFLMLFRIVDAISDCFYGYLQANDKLYQVGISYFLKSFFGIILFLLIDYFTKNISFSLIILIMVNILFFIFYDLKCFRKITKDKIKIDFLNSKIILKKATPIFLFSFLAMYLANCQKYVITYFSKNELQTIFGILIMPATVLSLIGNYLIHPFINTLNKYKISKKYDEFNRLTLKILLALFAFGILALIGTYLIGIKILNIIYQINLNKYKLDLLMIIISAIFYSATMIISGVLTLINVNKSQTYIYFICSIISTISCYYFIKNDIIDGSTFSYLLTSVVLLLIFMILYTKNMYKLKKGI